MVRMLPSVLNWVTKTEGSWAYIGRSTVAAVATIAFYYATNAVVSLWMDNPIIDPANLEDSFAKAFSFSHPITAAILGALLGLGLPGRISYLCSLGSAPG